MKVTETGAVGGCGTVRQKHDRGPIGGVSGDGRWSQYGEVV